MVSLRLETKRRVMSVTPQRIFGYEVIDRLGNGAGSSIYLVTHPTNRQVYALKHVERASEKDIRFVEQLENEFAVGKKVRHPKLRGVIDFHVQKKLMVRVTEAALVMELVDGRPLDAFLPRKLSDILDVFIQTAEALKALHDAGYVHCDLKPGNILLNSDGSVKVIDLGQACVNGTVKLRIQGTPDFISPEQVKCKPVNALTDVFNFGATLYWAITGSKLPTLFNIKKGENSFLVDSEINAPHKLNPTVPENLSNFVMDCVRTSPHKRPESIAEVSRRCELMKHSLLKLEDASGPTV